MRIIVKNKFVSWGGGSKVEDEAGNALYRVKGKAFSWTRRKTLKDLNGNVLYRIRNKWPSWLLHSAFICDANGKKLLKIRQNINFNHIYAVEDCADDVQFDGHPLYGLQVAKNGAYIGTITKKVWALRDYFMLDLPDGTDPTFMIALTIAIDNIQDKANRSAK